MKGRLSPSTIMCCITLILLSIPDIGHAARKVLLDFPIPPISGFGSSPPTVQMPPPTPVNNLTYQSENKNGSHAQIVYVNGKPRSESGTVNGKDGHPVIKGDTHNNSRTANVNGPAGKPLIQGTDKDGSQTAIIKDKDGKPLMEVHTYPNGTKSVTFFDSSGKPMYNINYLPPPGQQRGPSSNPAITP